jgi:quercetin dioxygenase-like cupin family protein
MKNHATSTHAATRDLAAEIQIPEKGILSHTLFNDDSVKLILFGFAPGQELTAHTAPMPATIQVLEGEASITLGQEVMEAERGCLIHMQPGLVHGIVAKSPLLMLLTLVKAGRVDGKQTKAA